MAEFAVNASVPQLRRSLTKYSFDPPAATGQDNAATGDNTAGDTEAGDTPSWNGFALVEDRASAPAQLSISHDQWGRLSLRFTAPADQDAFRTHNHLDTAGGWLTGRPRLPKHLADKLTRDGIPQPLRLTAGAPVNVGRAQRIVPARTRRLVEDRDRGCRFPGCNATAHLQCHHLTHWADGGPTDTANLACPCPYHHDSHHDSHHNGTFTVAGNANDPDGLTFTTNGGFPIRPGPTFTTPHPTAATTPATRCTGVTHTEAPWV